jgi:AraC-like DNA-binding protein
MEFQFKYITPDIKLSCNESKFSKMEVMFNCHMLVWFISGETKIIQPEQTYIFQTRDIFLIPKNQLATIINYPKDGLSHQSVIMHLTTERLREFYAKLNIKPKPGSTHKIQTFGKHALLESCLSSLIPYFDMQEDFPEEIASLKITEAITILRTINPEIDNLLADFSEPYKINLSEFMEKNFIFNMPLEKYAYLTGRSLATFKRDFKKIFQTTPQKWLIQKRLELAYRQITENKQKPIEVYLETGFENLSHFSFAFKKHFGFAPSALMNK